MIIQLNHNVTCNTINGWCVLHLTNVPWPHNQIRRHIKNMAVSWLQGASDQQMDKAFQLNEQWRCGDANLRREHNKQAAIANRTQLAKNGKMYRLNSLLQDWYDSGHANPTDAAQWIPFKRWVKQNDINSWYSLRLFRMKYYADRVEILYPRAKYNRMKKKRLLRNELNKLETEIAKLQRRKKKIKQHMNNRQHAQNIRDNKASVS